MILREKVIIYLISFVIMIVAIDLLTFLILDDRNMHLSLNKESSESHSDIPKIKDELFIRTLELFTRKKKTLACTNNNYYVDIRWSAYFSPRISSSAFHIHIILIINNVYTWHFSFLP